MKSEKGQQVFGDNVDDILTQKIVEHTEKNSGSTHKTGSSASSASQKSPSSGSATFFYHTPEQRRRKARRYGIATIVLLFLLGIITFFWSKFRDD